MEERRVQVGLVPFRVQGSIIKEFRTVSDESMRKVSI
jgi:hypothetical protein